MSIGFDREQNLVNMGDSAELYAYLLDKDDSPLTEDDLLAVRFTIEKPDGTRVEEQGAITEEGYGFLRFADTDQEGEYKVVARFTLDEGQIKSTRADFEVEDPLGSADPTDEQEVTERVWQKIQDCFDSNDGGPWLRDMTMAVFSPRRVEDFIPEAIFDINLYNPPTNFAIDKFTVPVNNAPNPNITLLVQGTFIAVIRHLMRAYAEQPLPQGGQVTYEDRRDYMQRWGTIYQIEWQHYDHLVKLWKRQFLGLGEAKSIVSSKAGRLLPAPLRSRNIGRGYY